MGFEACKDYVAENASFNSQSEVLAEVISVKNYVNWIAGLGTTMPGNSCEISASAYDEDNNTAIFFSTFTGHIREMEGRYNPQTLIMSMLFI